MLLIYQWSSLRAGLCSFRSAQQTLCKNWSPKCSRLCMYLLTHVICVLNDGPAAWRYTGVNDRVFSFHTLHVRCRFGGPIIGQASWLANNVFAYVDTIFVRLQRHHLPALWWPMLWSCLRICGFCSLPTPLLSDTCISVDDCIQFLYGRFWNKCSDSIWHTSWVSKHNACSCTLGSCTNSNSVTCRHLGVQSVYPMLQQSTFLDVDPKTWI